MATATETKTIPVVNNVITDEEVAFGHEKVNMNMFSNVTRN